jgi:hypothetical protein
MNTRLPALCAIAVAAVLACGTASAALNPAGVYNGNVGLSVDGVGSTASNVGFVQADIPVGATILQAYLYSAGTPHPWYSDSPRTLADYNSAGITLAGTPIVNFSTLVGAVATPRPDIGRWYTGRADVTALVQSLTAGAVTNSFSWAVSEGTRSNRIDGNVLAIVYSHASLPTASVALLDGGQNTGGETTIVGLGAPLPDTTLPGFAASLGFGISFSCCNQQSTIRVNGSVLTETAGGFNDGAQLSDGSLITVGGLGDNPGNNVGYASDDELYDLKPFLATGANSFSIGTVNATNDDNIFFAHLYITAEIKDITPVVPEPSTYALMLAGLAAVGALAKRRSTPARVR